MKVLCLSFWTPPIVRPQAILIGKMLPEWLRQGIEPILITYDSCGKWDIPVPTYYIPQYLPRFRYNRLFNKLPLLPAFQKQRYYERLYTTLAEVIKQHHPDLIFSFANPQVSNILGAMLKERLHVPFIAHFSDPWYDSARRSLFFWQQRSIRRQEEYIIKTCDRVVFIAPELRDLVMRKYESEWQTKARVIPHCYDGAEYPRAVPKTSNQLVLSHLGIFRHERNPEVLFQAIKILLAKHPELAERLVVNLIGGINTYTNYTEKDLTALINRYNLGKQVKIIPTVSYVESLRHMKQSDCLIVIDTNMRNCPFILSKVIDYAGSGTSALGIMAPDNPTAIFLRRLGYRSFDYTEAPELAEYLYQLNTKQIHPQHNWEFARQFEVKNTTRQLINIFKEVAPA